MKTIPHFINGQPYEGRNGRYTQGFNPPPARSPARFRWLRRRTSTPTWRPPLKRARILFKFKALLDEHQDELAALITAEHGKVFSDAKGEVTRGIEVVEFACGIPHLLKGQYTDQIGGGIDNWSMRQPLGVVAGITRSTFP